ncbi:MAG: hypothetical protein LUD51_03705 [Clostridia bacterium]|nr:hypothetical protein [Clostridia bacterium]
MNYIVIIIVVVLVFVLVMSSYARGKHVPREIKPKDPAKQDEDHKCLEVRAQEGQLQDIIDEYQAKGWTFESKETKPNTGMFGSDIWYLTFHRTTREEAEALEAKRRKTINLPDPIPAEKTVQPAEPAEDPFGMAPAPDNTADEDTSGMAPAHAQGEGDDLFGFDSAPQPADEDPFADEPPQLPPAKPLEQASGDEKWVQDAPENGTEPDAVPAERADGTDPADSEAPADAAEDTYPAGKQ